VLFQDRRNLEPIHRIRVRITILTTF
jgi:hypothetical protein